MSGERLPPWSARQGAVILTMLQAVEAGVREGKPADRVLHKLLTANRKYGSRDRRVISDAVFAWFRWHGAVGELPLAEGLCAAWALEGAPWPPGVQAVAEDLGWPVPEPHGLEDVTDRGSWLASELGLTVPEPADWLPDWWQAETEHLGPFALRLQEHMLRPPTWIRVDKALQPTLHADLLSDGAVWAGENSPCAYAFTKPGQVKAWRDKHPKGIEIQDLSSQQVVRVCDPQPGQTWWDACCGSGGKSLHLLDLANRDLNLTCTDKRQRMVDHLVKRARAHGLGKLRHYALDLTAESVPMPNLKFDGILLDAPCSGTGTWSRNPDAAWRTEAKDIRQAARRQVALLQQVTQALPSGGVLVYAVCSLTRSETLEVVRDYLAGHPAMALDPFAHPLTGAPTDGTLTLTPGETRADGMYIARFKRS